MDGEDVTKRGWEFHGQMGSGDNNTEGVERRTAQEDIVGCGCVDDKEADGNSFGLGSITKHGVKVDVAACGNLFTKEAIDWFVIWDHGYIWELEFLISGPVENVNRATLVNEDFLNGVVFNFNSDDHGVILLVVEAVKVVVCEDDVGHATSVMEMSNMVDGLNMAEVFLSGRRGGSSTSEATRDGVDSTM